MEILKFKNLFSVSLTLLQPCFFPLSRSRTRVRGGWDMGDLYLCNLVSRVVRVYRFLHFYILYLLTRSFLLERIAVFARRTPRILYKLLYVVRSTVVCTVQVYILLILTSLGFALFIHNYIRSAIASRSSTAVVLRTNLSQT